MKKQIILDNGSSRAYDVTSFWEHFNQFYNKDWKELADFLEQVSDLLPQAIDEENKQWVVDKNKELKMLYREMRKIKTDKLLF